MIDTARDSGNGISDEQLQQHRGAGEMAPDFHRKELSIDELHSLALPELDRIAPASYQPLIVLDG